MEDGDCYCRLLDPSQQAAGTFQCLQCRKRFHSDCLMMPVQSPLQGDTFYKFKCKQCGEDKQEEFDRAKMSWLEVVQLTLYNLQLGVGGKCGYFRWKEHICAFIDKHWAIFFGSQKKKTSTWHGTIAGTLSANCPLVFMSGSTELAETGWWKLVEMKPPVFYVDPPNKTQRRPRQSLASEITTDKNFEKNILDCKRPRRSKPFSITAASELKAKRISVIETQGRKRKHTNMVELNQAAVASTIKTDLDSHIPTKLTIQSQLSPAECLPSAAQSPVNFPDSQTLDDTSFLSCAEESSLLTSRSSSQGDLTLNETSPMFVFRTSKNNLAIIDLGGVMMGPSELIDNADSDDNLEIDPGSVSPTPADWKLTQSPGMDELMMNITAEPDFHAASGLPSEDSRQALGDLYCDAAEESEGPSEEGSDVEEDCEGEDEEEEERGNKVERMSAGKKVPTQRRYLVREKRRTQEKVKQEEDEDIPNNLHLMTPYDENRMLKHLNAIMSVEPIPNREEPLQSWEVDRLKLARNGLRRKLIVRKLKRENGLPVFDLDAVMTALAHAHWGVEYEHKETTDFGIPMNKRLQSYSRTLDRYLAGQSCKMVSTVIGFELLSLALPVISFSLIFLMPRRSTNVTVQHTTFRTRLVGFEDDQLEPVISPYTMRLLKPFIWRDKDALPKKVRLLQEIIAYPHRKEPSWSPPPPASLDYCYVRPQHIPSVNALCRAFFWPGIDMSECLQYPDFSCVVMYKKVVVAFAFMVPDVKHNEVYISFIFTHPEWRGAGIATFMLYHLIQTCMGKDVTLHVSATNTAMLLYQKFGFKAEELCLDFYDKYFPVGSRECKHAVFMRMRR